MSLVDDMEDQVLVYARTTQYPQALTKACGNARLRQYGSCWTRSAALAAYAYHMQRPVLISRIGRPGYDGVR
eukprot:3059316-Rhodomonas_salina.2